MQFGLVML